MWASGDGCQDDNCNCDMIPVSGQSSSVQPPMTVRQLATTSPAPPPWLQHSATARVRSETLECTNLTWRDIQHLTVFTSKRNRLFDPYLKHFWQYNGAGLEFNHLFGYGVLDAGAMVYMANHWKPLPERFHCTAGSIVKDMKFGTNEPITMTIDTDACKGSDNEVNFLEHLQAFVTVKSSYRGNIVMHLTSPMNTTSMILSQRPDDDEHKNGFTRWPFMTTHTWAEAPRGTWTLRVENVPGKNNEYDEGIFREWTLVLHGTRDPPYHHQDADEENQTKLFKIKRMHDMAMKN